MNGNSNRQQDNDWNNFGPRVGLAWNVTDKLVIRTGYGIVYSPITTRYMSNSNQGFSATTNYLASTDGNIAPAGTLHDPFPAGIIQPIGAAPGLLGGLVKASPRCCANRQCLTCSGGLSMQRSLRPIGAGSGIPGQQGHETGDADRHQHSAFVSICLWGMRCCSRWQLLPEVLRQRDAVRRYRYAIATVETVPAISRPDEQHDNLGASTYHAVTLKMEKRFSHGVSVLAVFTGGKMLTDTTPWTVGFLDNRHRFRISSIAAWIAPSRLKTFPNKWWSLT